MAFSVDLKPGQQLQIGDAIVTFVQKSGQAARFEVDADKSVIVKKLSEESASINLIANKGIMTA